MGSVTGSSAAPVRCTLFDESARSFLCVLGAEHPLTVRFGKDLCLMQREVEALADGKPRSPHRKRSVSVDEVGHLAGALLEVVMLDDLGHHSQFVGPLSAEALVTPGQ